VTAFFATASAGTEDLLADELRALDDLLWTFSDQSFVPHAIRAGDTPADAVTPVQPFERSLGVRPRAILTPQVPRALHKPVTDNE